MKAKDLIYLQSKTPRGTSSGHIKEKDNDKDIMKASKKALSPRNIKKLVRAKTESQETNESDKKYQQKKVPAFSKIIEDEEETKLVV